MYISFHCFNLVVVENVSSNIYIYIFLKTYFSHQTMEYLYLKYIRGFSYLNFYIAVDVYISNWFKVSHSCVGCKVKGRFYEMNIFNFSIFWNLVFIFTDMKFLFLTESLLYFSIAICLEMNSWNVSPGDEEPCSTCIVILWPKGETGSQENLAYLKR